MLKDMLERGSLKGDLEHYSPVIKYSETMSPQELRLEESRFWDAILSGTLITEVKYGEGFDTDIEVPLEDLPDATPITKSSGAK